MVGQINVLVALADIGSGDGPTVLVSGSHKSTEVHPRLWVDGKGKVSHGREPAGTAVGMKEMYMKAGDALFFTDAITQRMSSGKLFSRFHQGSRLHKKISKPFAQI
jgi:ectoine hydroxylase-related dioxygenase (phytanoyl-CoA dioxygenase family)